MNEFQYCRTCKFYRSWGYCDKHRIVIDDPLTGCHDYFADENEVKKRKEIFSDPRVEIVKAKIREREVREKDKYVQFACRNCHKIFVAPAEYEEGLSAPREIYGVPVYYVARCPSCGRKVIA